VEDEYFVALDLEQRLLEAGFEVVGIAAMAEEALEIAATRKPELAIMDIRLAGPRDGVDTAVQLLADLRLPSIFATAHADPETKKRAEQAQPLGWLQKPYSTELLIEVVTAALERAR
jgi:DNA-binding NarL/FixJ family response regulator